MLAIAIGFGAQSVVADLFAGLFMLTEDQFGVGDRVDVGPVNGYVERITLRTTVIRDANGKVWHIPNSKIDYVANETQSWARAVVVVGVAYSADLDRAVAVLEDAVTQLAESGEWAEHVEEIPPVQSVYELGADSVDIRVLLRVTADQRRAIERALRLRCKEALDGAGIEMPNRTVDIYLKDSAVALPGGSRPRSSAGVPGRHPPWGDRSITPRRSGSDGGRPPALGCGARSGFGER